MLGRIENLPFSCPSGLTMSVAGAPNTSREAPAAHRTVFELSKGRRCYRAIDHSNVVLSTVNLGPPN